ACSIISLHYLCASYTAFTQPSKGQRDTVDLIIFARDIPIDGLCQLTWVAGSPLLGGEVPGSAANQGARPRANESSLCIAADQSAHQRTAHRSRCGALQHR